MKISIPVAVGLLLLVAALAIYLFPKPHQIGQALEQSGRLDEALEYYSRALEQDPEDESTWVRVATVHELRGQPDDAIRIYRRLTDLDPTNVGYHRHLALVYKWNLQIDESLRELAKVADLEPRDVGSRQELSRYAVLRSKDYDEAIRRLEQILVARPSDVETLVELAQLYVQTRQPQKAILAYDRALEEDPENPQMVKLRAKAVAWQQEAEIAIGKYRAALAVDPSSSVVVSNLVFLLRSVGQETEAQALEARSTSLQGAGP